MKLNFTKIVLFAAVMCAVGCSSDVDNIIEEQQPEISGSAQTGEVRIAVSEQTRSSLVNGGELRWESGDEISLLAFNSSDSSVALSPSQFKFVASKHNGEGSYFTAMPNELKYQQAMSEDAAYDYYAISPSLNAVNESLNRPTLDGTTLTFNIPAEQDGRFRADRDLMVARANGKPALKACEAEYNPDGTVKEETVKEFVNNLDLVFYHRTHILHFTIPENFTNGLGNEIKKVYLLFPEAVVGKLSFDIKADVTYDAQKGITSPTPTYSDASKKIEVEFDSPMGAGDEFWVMTFPYAGGLENVDIRFEDTQGNVSERRKIALANMSANSATPIKVATVPQKTGVTSFYYTVEKNNLGENLTSMNMTLPDGYYFTDFEQKGKVEDKDKDGRYTFSIFNDMFADVKNLSLPFELESENALFKQTKTIGDVKTDSPQEAITVPYLFAEDFSGIPTFNDGHDNPTVGLKSDTYKDIIELSEKSKNTLKNWYGTRIGSSQGQSVRICCRYENVLNLDIGDISFKGSGYYKGRLYTPFLTNIKKNKRPTVVVSFKYATDRKEMGKLSWTGYKYPNADPILYFGVNNQDVVTNPDQNESDEFLDKVTGLIAGVGFSNSKDVTLSPRPIDGEALGISGGSYPDMKKSKSVEITVDSNSRLAWIVSCNNKVTSTNGNYWFYIDNITVKIAENQN